MSEANRWKTLPVEDKVCCLIAYAAVFNDVLKKQEIFQRLGIYSTNEIDTAIEKLLKNDKIIEKNGFLTIKELEGKIDKKEKDYALTKEIINKKLKTLKIIGKLPFIDFIGISGSLAAGNPVSSSERKIDIDVFIITRSNSTWIVGLFTALFHGLTPDKQGKLCFNHIWDRSDLEVYNKNFYIATETYNLIPISGMSGYQHFLRTNPWLADYFPALALTAPSNSTKKDKNFVLSTINKLFYLIFTTLKCIKNHSFQPFKEMSYKIDHSKQMSLKRRGAENGGYQQLILPRFIGNLKKYFPDLDSKKIGTTLFPDKISKQIRSSEEFDFRYRLSARNKIDWAVNYSKYETKSP